MQVRTIRVLLVDLSQRFGGADVRVINLARLLADEFVVSVVVLAGSETESRLHEARVPLIAIRGSRRDPRLVAMLVSTMRSFRPDIVDMQNIQSQLWGSLAAAGLRIPVRILTVHSNYEESERLGKRLGLYRRLLRAAERLSTHVVAVSSGVDDFLQDAGVGRIKRSVIVNAVETPQAETRRRPFEDKGACSIVAAGRLVPVKGHRYLIEALADPSLQSAPVECHLLGAGNLADTLRQLAEDRGVADRVFFHGYRTDVAEFLATSDVFCMPSLSEGLPLALLEAALLERPIIASAVGGIAAYFRDGDTLRLVEPGRPDRLAETIVGLLANPQEAVAMGRRARRFVEENFSLDAMRQATADLYRRADAERLGA